MIRDATEYAEQDAHRRDELKYLATAEGLIFSFGKAFAACGQYLPDEKQAEIKVLLETVKQAAGEKNAAVIRANESKLIDAQELLTSAAIAASEDMISISGENDDDESSAVSVVE
jgi:molecular chaperone DnaK